MPAATSAYRNLQIKLQYFKRKEREIISCQVLEVHLQCNKLIGDKIFKTELTILLRLKSVPYRMV